MLLDGKELEKNCPEVMGAYALFNDPEVKKLFAGGYTAYQGEYKYIRSATNKKLFYPVEKGSREVAEDGGTIGLIGYTDFETEDLTIDIKTAANGRSEKDVVGAKRQAKMYSMFRGGKPVKFVVLNKKDFSVKIFTVVCKSYEDLFDHIDEFEIAYTNQLLFEKPSFMGCKFCSFNDICTKGRGSGIN